MDCYLNSHLAYLQRIIWQRTKSASYATTSLSPRGESSFQDLFHTDSHIRYLFLVKCPITGIDEDIFGVKDLMHWGKKAILG